jgi:hypothetical protein
MKTAEKEMFGSSGVSVMPGWLERPLVNLGPSEHPNEGCASGQAR